MMNFKTFILAFIPIFVAVDALGVLPLFISFTESKKRLQRLKIIRDSIITAAIVAIVFIFVGKSVFRFLGITVYDFMVAGGVLLFILAINDLLRTEKSMRIPEATLGVVPLGMPLIVGPAVLTTSLMMLDAYGLIPTLSSVILNIIIAGGIFMFADFIMRLVGNGGTRAISKVASLFLAAIAVMMIRKGLIHIYLDFLK
ncbi:MAG: MarC family protein [Candidatus Omnitrophica bacterium]|nr:MarC family protein [Candidatus Omnitrophota bacterium]